jgi:hypothetical protein
MIGLLMLLHFLTAAFGTEPEYHRVRCDGGDQGSSRPRLNVRQTTQMTQKRSSSEAAPLILRL